MPLDLDTELQKLLCHLQPSTDIKPRPTTFISRQSSQQAEFESISALAIPVASDSGEASLPVEEPGA
jgi:hypothetical protein